MTAEQEKARADLTAHAIAKSSLAVENATFSVAMARQLIEAALSDEGLTFVIDSAGVDMVQQKVNNKKKGK